VWDVDAKMLWWVDIPGSIHRFDPATGSDALFETEMSVGALALRVAGGLVLAVENGFAVVDAGEDPPGTLVVGVEADDPSTRFNDGKVDPAGRFWAGTMADDEARPVGHLYRLDADRNVTAMLEELTISNGLAWSPDGRTMYFIDSATKRVDCMAFDQERGEIGDRRTFVDLSGGAALPDGMTIDSEGAIWVALWGGWGVHRYLPDGTLDRVIDVPVGQVTSCTFGGDRLDELYITSARDGLSQDELDEQPLAGGLFRCEPGVAGLPPDRFAG
jgi:sugar lactone lactonase YvrE